MDKQHEEQTRILTYDIDSIGAMVENLRDNHAKHIQQGVDELHEKLEIHNKINDLAIIVSRIEANQAWLTRGFWVVATATVGGLVSQIIQIV